MNNNPRAVRSSSQKQSHKSSAIGTRHSSIATPNNNIHININLNVKKKSHCYHPEPLQGKKINNYFELSDLKHPEVIQEHQNPKTTAIGKQKFLVNKTDTNKNLQKAKKKKTKEKQKTASKPFTPEKHFKPQSEQKSLQKSRTNKKLARKKQSKSMQNIKVFKQKPLHLQQPKHTLHQSKNPMQQTKNHGNYLNYQKEKNKLKSRSNSSSKQRSRQKSGQKLKKMRSSSKNIVSFQNSGIKKILATQKQSGTKNQAVQNMRKSKKSLKVNKIAERDMIKINEFMEEKKKQEQKRKKESEHNSKDIKIKDEVMKLSKKEFYTKPQKSSITHSVSEYKKKSKFPMFYGEQEENNNDQDNDNRAHGNYNKNTRLDQRTPERSRPYNKINNMSPSDNHKRSSGKKRLQECLVEKYINGEITKGERKQLKKKVICIQASWRGYWLRKNLMQEIAKISKVTSHKKRMIQEKKSEFWDDDENNSIINLDNDERDIHKPSSSGNKQNISHQKNIYKTPSNNSNYNSSQVQSEQNHTNKKKYESQSGHQNQFLQGQSHQKRLNVNEFRKNIEKLQQNKYKKQQKSSSAVDSRQQESQQNNSLLASQIQMLKKQIQEQNKKFIQLEQENTELRQNLKSIVVEKQKQKDLHQHQHVLNIQGKKNKHNFEGLNSSSNSNSQPISPIDIDDDSVVIYELNRGHFVANHNNRNQPKPQYKTETKEDTKKHSTTQKFKSLQIQTNPQQLSAQYSNPNPIFSNQSPSSSSYIHSLKRQLQSFQSPSNRSLKSAQLSNLKGLQKAFKKKQLSIDATYQKNALLYQQMLQNNIVSPRTYSFKKVELEEKYKKQKQEITMKYHEAEKVIKYISEEIVEEERMGEDQSPEKIITQNQEEHIISKKNNDQVMSKKQQVLNKGLTKSQLQKQIQSYTIQELSISNDVNSSTHSNFRKYWTDDMEQVHKKVLQISNKIDQALEADSKYSQSVKSDNQQYSSQNSNFNSLKSNQSGQTEVKPIVRNTDPMEQMKSPIFQETEYKIQEKNQNEQLSKTQQQEEQQVIANNSNVSSTSSGRNLQAYNIHYPSSPKSQKAQTHSKHNFQVRHQNYEEQASLQNNNSQLSQNRSSLSQNSLRSSFKPSTLKGFDTRLTFIKQYCIALCEFIRSQQPLKQSFITNISGPLKYDYFELLRSYRTTMGQQNDTRYNSTLEDYVYPYFKVLRGSLGEKGLNKGNTGRFEELYEQNYHVNKEVQLTVEMRQIRGYFIQAIIDVFNESLDFQRPGSIYGQPLPWLVQSKNLKNNQVKYLNEPQPNKKHKSQHNNNEQSDQNQSNQQDQRLDKIFGVAIAKIIQWGSCLCGFIPEPVSFDGQDAQAVNIDDEQTNLVRETRLAYMLEKSLAEDEEKMVDSTMEQLEVQLEVQQMVLYELITEVTEELVAMGKAR